MRRICRSLRSKGEGHLSALLPLIKKLKEIWASVASLRIPGGQGQAIVAAAETIAGEFPDLWISATVLEINRQEAAPSLLFFQSFQVSKSLY